MKDKAIIIKCSGEAHTNPRIDNCNLCMPYWEKYPICPIHKNHKDKLNKSGYCKECKKFYDVKELRL